MNFRFSVSKWLMIACISFSVASLAGCAKDYDDEIKKLNNKVDENQKATNAEFASQRESIRNAIATASAILKSEISTEYRAEIQAAKDELDKIDRDLEASIRLLTTDVDAFKEQVRNQYGALYNKIFGSEDIGSKTLTEYLKEYTDGRVSVVESAVLQLIHVEIPNLKNDVSGVKDRVSDLETFKGTLEGPDGLLAKLQKADADMKLALDVLQGKLDESNPDSQISLIIAQIQSNAAEITTLKAELAKVPDQIKAAIDALDVTTKIADAEKRAVKSAKTYADATFVTKKEFQQKMTAELPAALKGIVGPDFDLKAMYDQVQLNSAMRAELTTLKDEVNAKFLEITGNITRMETEIQANTTQIAQNTARLDAIDVSLAAITAQVRKNTTAIAAIDAKISTAISEAFTVTLRDIPVSAEFAAMYPGICVDGKIALSVDDHLSTLYNAVAKNMKEIALLKTSLSTLDAKLVGVDGTVKEAIEASINALRVDLGTWINGGLNDTIAAAVQALADKVMTKEEVAAAITAATSGLETAITTMGGKVTILETRVDGIASDVDKMKKRVQSFVFDSKFSDDRTAATAIINTLEGQALGEATFPFEFTVSPASAASSITEDKLTFELNTVTMSRATVAASMSIKDLTTNTNTGKVTFTAKLANFDGSFFGTINTKAYRVKVRFNNEGSASTNYGENILSNPILLTAQVADVAFPALTFEYAGAPLTTLATNDFVNFGVTDNSVWNTAHGAMSIPLAADGTLPPFVMPALTVKGPDGVDMSSKPIYGYAPNNIAFTYTVVNQYTWDWKTNPSGAGTAFEVTPKTIRFDAGTLNSINPSTTYGDAENKPLSGQLSQKLVVKQVMTSKANGITLNTSYFVIKFKPLVP